MYTFLLVLLILDAIILATPPFAAVVPEVARVEGWVY